MTVSPADVIQQFLIDNGVGKLPPAANTEWPVTVDAMPDNKEDNDNYVTIYNTGSDLQGRENRSGHQFEFPTVQVRVRGKNDEVAQAKGYEIQDLCRRVGFGGGDGLGRVPVTTEGVAVQLRAAHLKTALAPLRTEELNRRKVYVINLKLTIWEV